MSSSPNFPDLDASRTATDSAALDHLVATVNRLVRAERRQAMTHYSLAGLFWGMVAACIAVLAVRLSLLPASIGNVSIAPVSTTKATLVCMIVGLATGLATAWVTRRSPLSVAILADIRLNLKQRLSSAWELYENDKRSAPAAAISHQLLKSRTPIAHRLFPLSGKSGSPQFVHPGIRWSRLLPAVALLLMLINTLDFEQLAGQRGEQVDDAVQREGKTLRSYGSALALRADNDNLAASSTIAVTMRQLGRRMEGGTLARGPALKRLNELRHDISNSHQKQVPRNGHDGAVSERDLTRARRIIENAIENALENAAGEVTNGATPDPRDDTSLQRALVTADINAEVFRQALEEADNGDAEKLEALLEELLDGERAARDAEELERAYERVQNSRENLGAESQAPSSATRGLHTDDDFADEHAGGSEGENSNSSSFVFQDHSRPGGRAPSPDIAQDNATEPVSERDHPSVRTKGKIGEGREVATQTRIAPKIGEVTTPVQDKNLQQRQQLEAVLSKDTLPAHQKAYVRRYFLELSRAVEGSSADEPSE